MDTIELDIDTILNLEKASTILKIEFEEQDDFYKNRHDDICNQMLACKINDSDNVLGTFFAGPNEPFNCAKSIYLVSKFLSTVDRNLEKEFWDDFSNGSIVMEKGCKKGNCFHFYENRVYVDVSNTIVDAFVLLHEFIHKISADVSVYGANISENYNNYAEAISILGEFLFKDFLSDLGFSPYELELFTGVRKNGFNYEIDKIISINPFINLIEENGFITKEGFDKIKENCNMYFDPVKKIRAINSHETNILYHHSLGCVVASCLYDRNISNLEFRDLIKTLNYSSIEEFEEKLGLSKDYDKNSKWLLKTFNNCKR